MEKKFDEIVQVEVLFASDDTLFKKLLNDVEKYKKSFLEDYSFNDLMAANILRILRSHYNI